MPTFAEAAKAAHAPRSEPFRNAKHKAQWLASLENDVFPAIGARPIDSIDSGDLLTVLTPIWHTKAKRPDV